MSRSKSPFADARKVRTIMATVGLILFVLISLGMVYAGGGI